MSSETTIFPKALFYLMKSLQHQSIFKGDD